MYNVHKGIYTLGKVFVKNSIFNRMLTFPATTVHFPQKSNFTFDEICSFYLRLFVSLRLWLLRLEYLTQFGMCTKSISSWNFWYKRYKELLWTNLIHLTFELYLPDAVIFLFFSQLRTPLITNTPKFPEKKLRYYKLFWLITDFTRA